MCILSNLGFFVTLAALDIVSEAFQPLKGLPPRRLARTVLVLTTDQRLILYQTDNLGVFIHIEGEDNYDEGTIQQRRNKIPTNTEWTRIKVWSVRWITSMKYIVYSEYDPSSQYVWNLSWLPFKANYLFRSQKYGIATIHTNIQSVTFTYINNTINDFQLLHGSDVVMCGYRLLSNIVASCQIRTTAGCACAGDAGNIFPATDFKGNRWLATPACIPARAWRMSGSLTGGNGENVPGIAGACATPQFCVSGKRPIPLFKRWWII